VSAPRSARALPALVARWRRRERPATPDAVRARVDPGRVRRILAIKPHDQLGDFLVATPALAALRARYPGARIDLVTRAYLAPLAVRQSAIDRVLVLARLFDPARPGSGPRVFWAAAHPRPDLAVVLNSVSRSRTADLLAAVSGARLVIGRSGVGAGPLPARAPATAFEGARLGEDPIYDLDLPCARGSDHQVDRLLDLVRWLPGGGGAGAGRGGGTPAEPPLPTLELGPEDHRRGEAALAAAARPLGGPAPGAPRIGLHPAAANALKCWPVDSFAAWADGVMEARRAAGVPPPQCFVLDTPKDPGPARALLAGLAARGLAAGYVPPLPLGDFAGACAGLDLVACNDSGVMHVASAAGAAVLSFHSLGWPAEWAPRDPGRARALHHDPIGGIAVGEAVAAAISLLGPADGPSR
jgi:ADP-heptose:LPS heptosyltransferase